jgi:hypothetical protein
MSAMRTFFVVFALSFHRLTDGVALSIQDDIGTLWIAFGAIALHEFVIALCIGIELVTSGVWAISLTFSSSLSLSLSHSLPPSLLPLSPLLSFFLSLSLSSSPLSHSLSLPSLSLFLSLSLSSSLSHSLSFTLYSFLPPSLSLSHSYGVLCDYMIFQLIYKSVLPR